MNFRCQKIYCTWAILTYSLEVTFWWFTRDKITSSLYCKICKFFYVITWKYHTSEIQKSHYVAFITWPKEISFFWLPWIWYFLLSQWGEKPAILQKPPFIRKENCLLFVFLPMFSSWEQVSMRVIIILHELVLSVVIQFAI